MALTLVVFVLAAMQQPTAAIVSQNGFLAHQKSTQSYTRALHAAPATQAGEPAPQHEGSLKASMIAIVNRGRQWFKQNGLAAVEPGVAFALRMKETPASQNTPPPQSPAQQFMTSVVSILIQVLITALVAFLYMKNKPESVVTVPEGDKKESLDGDFKHGLFSCFDLPGLSLFTFCCGGIRWADSMRMMGELTFYSAVGIWLGMLVLGAVTGGLFTWVGIAIIGTMYRQKIRAAFNMKSDNNTTVMDCLGWCCCTCCSIVQEARQVEEGKALSHSALQKELDFNQSL